MLCLLCYAMLWYATKPGPVRGKFRRRSTPPSADFGGVGTGGRRSRIAIFALARIAPSSAGRQEVGPKRPIFAPVQPDMLALLRTTSQPTAPKSAYSHSCLQCEKPCLSSIFRRFKISGEGRSRSLELRDFAADTVTLLASPAVPTIGRVKYQNIV